MTETAPPPSWRKLAKSWALTQIEGQSEVDIGDLANRAVEHFEGDMEFTKQLIEHMRPALYEIIIDAVGMTRSGRFAGVSIVQSDKGEAAKRASVFDRWLEHVNDHHVLLLDMTTDDVDVAIKERMDRGNQQISIGTFLTQVRSSMRKGERVRDRFTAWELEQRYRLVIDKTE